MEDYEDLLNKLGIARMVRLDHEELLGYLRENIVKIIFYSSNIEGNRLDRPAAELLLESGFVKYGGEFKDYLELLNHGEAYKSIIGLSSREITIQDIVDVRKILFSDMLGKDLGLRRFRNGIGMFVTSPVDDVKMELAESVKILNTKPSSHPQAILNALEFHLKFVHIHPFDDGVGRTTRLFMNLYLLKSGLKPMSITDTENTPYRDSLEWYHATYHKTVFIVNMLLFYLGSDGAEYLLEKTRGFKNDNPTEVEFASILNQLLGNPTPRNTAGDIDYLYDSKGVDVRFGLAALWISSRTKTDSAIIYDALASKDRNLRAAGIYAASQANISKYFDEIKKAAFNDEDEYNRLLAIHMLARGKKLDKDTILHALTQEQSEVVLCAILHALTLVDAPQPYVLQYLPSILHNGSVSVRRRAYWILIDYSSDAEVTNVLPALKGEDELVILPLIMHLRWAGRLNSDDIAKTLMALSDENKYFRSALLAELPIGNIKNQACPISSSINKCYLPLFDSILSSKDSTHAERAAALYALGMVNGYEYLATKHGISLNGDMDLPERLATLLVYLDSVKQGKVKPEAEMLPAHGPGILSSMEGSEAKLPLESHQFSEDFLSICRARLKQWEIN